MASLLGWLRRLFRKERPPVYLGRIFIVPRSDLRALSEKGVWRYPHDLDNYMQTSLEALFVYPSRLSRDGSREDDLMLELLVPDWRQKGAFSVPSSRRFWFLRVFWRPKVMVAARLVHMESGKTRFSCEAIEVLPWIKIGRGLFMNEVCTQRETNELKVLIYKACISVSQQMKEHLK